MGWSKEELKNKTQKNSDEEAWLNNFHFIANGVTTVDKYGGKTMRDATSLQSVTGHGGSSVF